jgi:hypothetical protein
MLEPMPVPEMPELMPELMLVVTVLLTLVPMPVVTLEPETTKPETTKPQMDQVVTERRREAPGRMPKMSHSAIKVMP